MKKLLFLLSFLFVASAASAAYVPTSGGTMNPFAYDLSGSFDQASMKLTVNYKLNAPATQVTIRIFNGNTVEKTQDFTDTEYRTKGAHSVNIDVSACSSNADLTWSVDVTGISHDKAQLVSNSNKLYYPTSIDIDNNPQNANFGTVFCIEGRHDAASTSGYISSINKNGAGLYVFNADGTKRALPYDSKGEIGVTVERYGWNGGKSLDDAQCRNIGNVLGFAPHRVRVSDDGRIFITSQTNNGEVLYEANKNVFSDTTGQYWKDRYWYRVISKFQNDGKTANTSVKMRESNRETIGNCTGGLSDCNIYNLYNISTQSFVAGPNVGFDVRGSGPGLQLLMLSGCKQAIANFTPDHYYCSEYNVGTASVWDTAPTVFFDELKGYVLRSDAAQAQYDKNGNIWICHYIKDGEKLSDSEPYYPLLKYNRATGTITKYNGIVHNYHRCGAMRFNHDFTKLAITTRGGTTGTGGYVTIYPIINGEPDFNSGTEIDLRNQVGLTMMDFAWDYADNLYIAADKAGESSYGRCIGIYAMPNTNGRNVVSTPANTSFTIECVQGATYAITANSNNQEWGTVAMTSSETLVNGEVPSCATVTVTATPTEHHRFVEWKVGEETVSTDPTYSFYAIKDLNITAHFAYAKHKVTWNNLFMKGKDIGTENKHYLGINERLWRMFQARFKYHPEQDVEGHVYNSYTESADVFADLDGRQYVRTDGLTYDTSKDDLMDFMENDSEFNWLKVYIESNNPTQKIGTDKAWAYHMFGFINRTNKIYYNSTTAVDPNAYKFQANYEDLGKPEHWTPIWTETVLGLPKTLAYGDYTPTKWEWLPADENLFRGRWVNSWHTQEDATGEFKLQRPDAWYKFNTVGNIKVDNPYPQIAIDDETHILAWRNGSTAGEIVTTITEDVNLYATYVEKKMDENDDPTPDLATNPYDATNDDVIQLMMNPNFRSANDTKIYSAHDYVKVVRKLQAGMYNTICLPLSNDQSLDKYLDLTQLHAAHPLYSNGSGTGATVLELTGITPALNSSGEDITVLNFEPVSKMRAGKPYLFKPAGNNDITEDIVFTTLTSITSNPNPKPVSAHNELHPVSAETNGVKFTFVPTINPTEVPAGSLILVANNRLALTTKAGQMAGLRGYFTFSGLSAIDEEAIAEQAAEGRVLLNIKRPTATSVAVAPDSEKQNAPEVRKLMHDNQIYIIRDNAVYTITGLRVK